MSTDRATWDRRFMRLARQAAEWSKDPDEGVGAVLVSADRRQFSIGYNGLPRGYDDGPHVLGDKELKNRLTCHAEVNALDQAPFDPAGATIYATKAPCTECCKAIHRRRVARVVCPPILPSSRWAEDQAFGRHLLLGLGVDYEELR